MAFKATISDVRPGNCVSAMRAPSGIPIAAASSVAVTVTASDSFTIANSAGSPVRISSKALKPSKCQNLISAGDGD